MKKLFASTTLGAVALAAAAGAQELPKTEINVVGNLGTTTQSRLLEAPFWAEGVTELSDGQITARFRPRNELGLEGPETFGLLADGVMNITNGALGHQSGRDPISDGNDLAGMTTSFDEFEAASESFLPVLQDYYRENLGLQLISLLSFQSQVLYCRDEFAGLQDVEGKRIRTSGASQADFISYLGGSPIDMSFGEVQQALDQGVIDCGITGTLGGYTSHWYEGASYIYSLPINFGAQAYVANAEWWDGLPSEVREFLETEINALTDEMWALNRKENEEGLLCNSTGPCEWGEPAGLTLVEPTEEDYALQKTAFEEGVLPSWIERCGEECREGFAETIAPVLDIDMP
ncbi:TRAP transporter substrate-binding protein [Allosediminivita pacifica]|uniref:TRAP-type C4-dicarboxylate transport system substrate-binding protein n=1 Tax=Allosediminivita pacifica TaxID=1267769 RepID=A0A2T6ATR3_9RHOB|nr:TRAP transporter substrate-binding protein [Allosediminivita pacifica]PTX47210.1 TRAP-type C4-dicarboxylate transport system substrate-binding protein [Allosediminivita pacifica]GGB09398.1 transporter [Allosediminivita pacifica]